MKAGMHIWGGGYTHNPSKSSSSSNRQQPQQQWLTHEATTRATRTKEGGCHATPSGAAAVVAALALAPWEEQEQEAAATTPAAPLPFLFFPLSGYGYTQGTKRLTCEQTCTHHMGMGNWWVRVQPKVPAGYLWCSLCKYAFLSSLMLATVVGALSAGSTSTQKSSIVR
jgi:hypothetical protein